MLTGLGRLGKIADVNCISRTQSSLGRKKCQAETCVFRYSFLPHQCYSGFRWISHSNPVLGYHWDILHSHTLLLPEVIRGGNKHGQIEKSDDNKQRKSCCNRSRPLMVSRRPCRFMDDLCAETSRPMHQIDNAILCALPNNILGETSRKISMQVWRSARCIGYLSTPFLPAIKILITHSLMRNTHYLSN